MRKDLGLKGPKVMTFVKEEKLKEEERDRRKNERERQEEKKERLKEREIERMHELLVLVEKAK